MFPTEESTNNDELLYAREDQSDSSEKIEKIQDVDFVKEVLDSIKNAHADHEIKLKKHCLSLGFNKECNNAEKPSKIEANIYFGGDSFVQIYEDLLKNFENSSNHQKADISDHLRAYV